MGNGGDLGGGRKVKRRQESIGPVDAKPEDLEDFNGKKAGREARGAEGRA